MGRHRTKPQEVVDHLTALPRDEQRFLRTVTVSSDEAVETLRKHHCCVIRGCLSAEMVEAVLADAASLERVSAIGEKRAEKRSGTRFYNCTCQLGPRCGFEGWRGTAARRVLGEATWRHVVKSLGFDHVARVEVVTGHAGCRAQDFHVDGSLGLTVIFALVDIDVAKGPTQLDFSASFVGFDGRRVKSVPGAPKTVHAGTLARGDVLIFNCNVLHRGTANLTAHDRPILVLDCSPRCGSSDAGFYPT